MVPVLTIHTPLSPYTPLSSPGSTGRSSTPRLLGSIAGFPAYWIPAFAGMTSYVWGDEMMPRQGG
jgi:hypothetical protein